MSHDGRFSKIEGSFIATMVGIVILFSTAVGTVLIAPTLIEPTWVEPTSPFQVQMYEEADPYFYIGRSSRGVDSLEYVQHIKAGRTLLAFQESEQLKIEAPEHLAGYVTRADEKDLKLTSRLLMLKEMSKERRRLFSHIPITQHVLELYEVEGPEAFAIASSDDFLAHYVDQDFKVLEESSEHPFHRDPGVIFVKNPQEYRVMVYTANGETRYRYDQNGKAIESLEMLKATPFGFVSRKHLIHYGENIYKQEGCWYCHTDQTRTLIQDTVLNGTDTFAAPPSSANEYIYQETSFLGTRRVGPDLSRVGIKRPSRDWHKAHFWSPKTASLGSIMPSFRHLFTYDPRGTSNAVEGVPNLEFEALYQYMLTKGTRMMPPSQSWWTGKDPLHTTLLIEGLVPNESNVTSAH